MLTASENIGKWHSEWDGFKTQSGSPERPLKVLAPRGRHRMTSIQLARNANFKDLTTYYTIEGWQHDCEKYKTHVIIRHKKFSPQVLAEMHRKLSLQPLLQVQARAFTAERGIFNLSELWLVGCHITPKLIDILLTTNLEKLHIEHAHMNHELAEPLARGLKNPINRLNTLQLIRIETAPACLKCIFEGVIAQNAYARGLRNLSLVNSLVDKSYANALEMLLAHSKHLVHLNLAGNGLGSANRAAKAVIIKKHTLEPALRYTPKDAILSIVRGTNENQEIGGALRLVTLCKNRLTAGDTRLLMAKEATEGHNKVQFNFARNGLALYLSNPRTLNSSPRNV